MSDASLRRASRLAALPPALAAAMALAWALRTRSLLAGAGVPFALPLDDSWIHLQLARNLAAGAGLAYRAPEWVAGSTAPLWTALLAAGSALGTPLAWARLLGVACFVASVEVTRRLALRLGLGSPVAWMAAAATAIAAPLVWGALSGLEIPLFTLLSLLGIHLHLADRRGRGLPLSLPVLSLAVLARPEGWLLLGLAVLDRLLAPLVCRPIGDRPLPSPRHASIGAPGPVPGVGGESETAGASAAAASAAAPPTGGGATVEGRRVAGGGRGGGAWRSTVAGLAVGALVLVPVCLFSWAVGGSPFPSTLAAKSTGWRWLPDAATLGAAWRFFLRVQPAATPLAVAGLALSLGRGRVRRVGLLPAAWPVALPIGLALIESPAGPMLGNFGRYLYPLLPLVVLLAGIAMQAAIELATGTARRLEAAGAPAGRPAVRRLLLAAAALLLLLPPLPGLWRGAGRFAHNVRDVEAGDGAVARWLALRVPPTAVLAVHDVGRIGYLLPNPLVDLAGILDADVREALRRGLASGRWQQELLAVLARRRPDYLVVFPRFVPFVEAPGLSFRRLHEVELPGNITMGDDRIAIYSTPWTRHPLREGGS